MSESEMVRAERIEADQSPEPRRSLRVVAAENYDEGGGLTNPTAWRLHRDLPEPVDPWVNGQIQCERCEEYHEPYCTHSRQLCAICAPSWCQSCESEQADAAAIAQEIYEEWHR